MFQMYNNNKYLFFLSSINTINTNKSINNSKYKNNIIRVKKNMGIHNNN